jgi:hypothetical protein
MDYTTVANLKLAMHVDQPTDDTLLAMVVTAASRALDRLCTGVGDQSAHNYFALETKTDEKLIGQLTKDGKIICFPHKPNIISVSSFYYQENVTTTEYSVPVARIDMIAGKVIAYPDNLSIYFPRRLKVRLSYQGGFSGSTAGLPEDLQDICTMLGARFYREAETGYSDVIGIAELATKIYTKAWPLRALFQIDTFERKVGWNYPA